jgi:hypothetical protein
VWPDAVVDEANLNRTVSMLRRALAQAGIDCIETIPKPGYRFTRARVPRGHRLGDRRRRQRGHADGKPALPWDRCERGRLHRLADVAEIVDNVVAEGRPASQ